MAIVLRLDPLKYTNLVCVRARQQVSEGRTCIPHAIAPHTRYTFEGSVQGRARCSRAGADSRSQREAHRVRCGKSVGGGGGCGVVAVKAHRIPGSLDDTGIGALPPPDGGPGGCGTCRQTKKNKGREQKQSKAERYPEL